MLYKGNQKCPPSNRYYKDCDYDAFELRLRHFAISELRTSKRTANCKQSVCTVIREKSN